MARFTSIGMPRKAFVPSAAEEARADDGEATLAEQPAQSSKAGSGSHPVKKSKRRGTRGRTTEVQSETSGTGVVNGGGGWGRDAGIASALPRPKLHRLSLTFELRENQDVCGAV